MTKDEALKIEAIKQARVLIDNEYCDVNCRFHGIGECELFEVDLDNEFGLLLRCEHCKALFKED